jgi:DNA topoisomerase-3
MKVLCVAEKNNISKGVSSSLSKNHFSTKDTKIKYVKNYTFNFRFPQWGECEVIFTAVSGHILTTQFVSGFEWGKVPHESLLSCPITQEYTDQNAKKIADNIIELAKNVDILMIWTDCDREGEYIGWEILHEAQKGNPSFNLETTYRARFSHLESSHIYRAACNPIRLDKLAIEAVSARMEVDLRAGYCLTRLLTDNFRPIFRLSNSGMENNIDKKKQDKMISYGTCQFPTLGFVVDRFKRIKYFKSEEFWYIKLSLKKGRKKFPFAWQRGHLFDRLLTICIYQDCISNQSENVIVKDIKNSPTSRYAPLPLTTVQLQKDCSNFFKFSAKETLNIAEKLYTQGLISYPRTETDSFPKNMDFKHFISMLSQSTEWGEYATMLLDESNNKFRIPRRGRHDDEAHPPIHPVGHAYNLTGKEKTVYEYIVRRFLACCSLDAKGSSTRLTVQWHKEFFSTSGETVLESNFLDIYKYSNWSSSSKSLPELKLGECVSIAEATVESGKTGPPQPLTETELIALMDSNGIGTDATIADHIEKILAREYITKVKTKSGKSFRETLQPTVLGYGLADGFSKIGFEDISLTKPFMRKDMEDNLKNICDGTKQRNLVLNDTLKVYHQAYNLTNERISVVLNAYKSALRHTESI